MKKFGRRIMALTLAGAMMCAPMTAFAQEVDSPVQDTVTGSGSVEDIVNMDVFKVVLPTVSVTSGDTTTNVLDFTLDPQQLLYTIDQQNSGTTYSDSTLYFANTGGTYSDTSDELIITNKGTLPVDVYLDASVSGLGDSGLSLATANSWSGNSATAKELYLDFQTCTRDVDATDWSSSSYGTANVIDTDGTSANAITLSAAKSGSYKLSKTGDVYSYELDTGNVTDANFAHMKVKFNGACNSAADWTETDAALTPQLDLTWTIVKSGDDKDSVTPAEAAPSVPSTFTFTKGTAATISVNLGSGTLAATKIKSVTGSSSSTGTFPAVTGLTTDGSVISLASSTWSGASNGDKRYIKVVFDDAANTTSIIEVTIAE